MSLEQFKQDLEEAGGVVNAELSDGVLRITYDAPQNYSTKRGEIRREYPSIEHVDTEKGHSGQSTLVYKES
jgi:hypothetical protein